MFAGTFIDAHDSTQILEGVLHTNSNNTYSFSCTFEPDNIFGVMESVGGINSVEEFISLKLLKEL